MRCVIGLDVGKMERLRQVFCFHRNAEKLVGPTSGVVRKCVVLKRIISGSHYYFCLTKLPLMFGSDGNKFDTLDVILFYV